MGEFLKFQELPPAPSKLTDMKRFNGEVQLGQLYPHYKRFDDALQQIDIQKYTKLMIAMHPPSPDHFLAAVTGVVRLKKDDNNEDRKLKSAYSLVSGETKGTPSEKAQAILDCTLPLIFYQSTAGTEVFEDPNVCSVIDIGNSLAAQWTSWLLRTDAATHEYSLYTPYSAAASATNAAYETLFGKDYVRKSVRRSNRPVDPGLPETRTRGDEPRPEDEQKFEYDGPTAVKAAQDWKDDANCRGAPAGLFMYSSTHEEAAKYCNDCGVCNACRAFGEQTKATGTFGNVWLKKGVEEIARKPGRPPNARVMEADLFQYKEDIFAHAEA